MNKNGIALFRWKVLAGDVELNKGISCQVALISTVKTDRKLFMHVMYEGISYYKLRI